MSEWPTGRDTREEVFTRFPKFMHVFRNLHRLPHALGGEDLCCLDFSETEGVTVRAVGMTLVTSDRIDSGGISVGLFRDPAT